MTSVDSRPPLDAGEKPLSGAARYGLMAGAALAVGMFYAFALLSIVALLALLVVEAAVLVVGVRFGFARVIAAVMQVHGQILGVFLKSFWLREGKGFRVQVAEAEAPELFAHVRRLSAQLQVPAPREVVLEMSAGAWVRLGGWRQGADATTLGLGYDLLAGLTEKEVEAVLAHEMAHAKLVRRGLSHLVNGGFARAAKLTNALAAHVEAYRRANQSFEIGGFFFGGANRCTDLAARLVTRYSRQDEFEADHEAALLCGAAPLRSALIKLDAIATRTARIGMDERVAQLQRPGGFTSWLVEELTVRETPGPDDSVETTQTDRYSTHPSLRDRIAAMPPDLNAAPDPGTPAIRLFADPDALAARLVAEIHRMIALAEKRDARERRRWLRGLRRRGGFLPTQGPGVAICVVGGIVALIALAAESPLKTMAWSIGIMAAGVGLTFLGRRRRDRRALPVPDYAVLRTAVDRLADSSETPEQRKTRKADLRAALEARRKAAPSRRAGKQLVEAECYEALARGDYLEAQVASDVCLETIGRRNLVGLTTSAIAAAALGQDDTAVAMLNAAHKLTRLRPPATRWAAAWTLWLLDDWAGTEAFLQEARQRTPDDSTLAALLAECEAQRNKLQSAIDHAREALAAAPREKYRIRLLLGLYVRGGYLRDAEKLLAAADPLLRADPEFVLAELRLQLLQREFTAADQSLARLRESGLAPERALEIAVAYERARQDLTATLLYREALQSGFYPAAELGLARLALHAHDRAAARTHALAALDSNRPLGPKATPALNLFAATTGFFLQLAETVTHAEAWIVTVTGNQVAGPLANCAFLVFAPDEKTAEKLFREIADAVQPAKPPLLPNHLGWQIAPVHQQPIGHVRPGIQRFWKVGR